MRYIEARDPLAPRPARDCRPKTTGMHFHKVDRVVAVNFGQPPDELAGCRVLPDGDASAIPAFETDGPDVGPGRAATRRLSGEQRITHRPLSRPERVQTARDLRLHAAGGVRIPIGDGNMQPARPNGGFRTGRHDNA